MVSYTFPMNFRGYAFVAVTSYGRATLGDDGVANKLFITFLLDNLDV